MLQLNKTYERETIMDDLTIMDDNSDKRIRLFNNGEYGIGIDVSSDDGMAYATLKPDEVKEMYEWLSKVVENSGK